MLLGVTQNPRKNKKREPMVGGGGVDLHGPKQASKRGGARLQMKELDRQTTILLSKIDRSQAMEWSLYCMQACPVVEEESPGDYKLR